MKQLLARLEQLCIIGTNSHTSLHQLEHRRRHFKKIMKILAMHPVPFIITVLPPLVSSGSLKVKYQLYLSVIPQWEPILSDSHLVQAKVFEYYSADYLFLAAKRERMDKGKTTAGVIVESQKELGVLRQLIESRLGSTSYDWLDKGHLL